MAIATFFVEKEGEGGVRGKILGRVGNCCRTLVDGFQVVAGGAVAVGSW